MEMQQLKLLASRVRDLLQRSNHPVRHNQSLDLVAALPGLRNWPEVQAFPDRVAACELDEAATARLAYRLKKRFDVNFSAHEVLRTLSTAGRRESAATPVIWPTGPEPGVYVTTSQKAIDALVQRYEEATDGAVLYAERPASAGDGAIDLGEYGLWSRGLDRVPSGTLIIVGPLELNQQSWSDSAERLEMACLHALASGHRVAVLVDTPTPHAMCNDIRLMARSAREVEDCEDALLGVVTEDGELQRREPFAQPWPPLPGTKSSAAVDAIPQAARDLLRDALTERTSGLLLLGSEVFDEHPGIELVAAALALTEHAGPAARIMSRKRGTPAKDWRVPEPIKQLPFLPSIESAYDQGYRRMVFTPSYANEEVLVKFAPEVLFIGGAYGFDVDSVFTRALQGAAFREEGDLLRQVIALLGVLPIPTARGTECVSDLFVMPKETIQPNRGEEIARFLEANRPVRWQDEITRLAASGSITLADVKAAPQRSGELSKILSQRGVPGARDARH